jgi:hypothetical protein
VDREPCPAVYVKGGRPRFRIFPVGAKSATVELYPSRCRPRLGNFFLVFSELRLIPPWPFVLPRRGIAEALFHFVQANLVNR